MEETLRAVFSGDIASDDATLLQYSHDASLLEVRPKVVLFPKNSADVCAVMKYVTEHKSEDPTLSVTARSAGTCMAGGSLNESIILDFTRYMHGIESWGDKTVTVFPGTFYRDFEPETLKRGLILPCFTASKNLCALGGMISNNCAGEKTLSYGKMENYIESLQVVFTDGKEYTVRPLSKGELDQKIAQNDFEASIYKGIWDLIQNNESEIQNAKPKVSKNSAGYYIWNVWDGKTFDLTKLIVGSQGTLGIVTKATLRLVPVKLKSKLFVIFMRDLNPLADLVNEILPFKPESLEPYDDSTMKLAVKFFPEMLKSMKATNFLKLIFSFIPEAGMILTGGLPKLILLVEFSGDSDKEIDANMLALEKKIAHFGLKTHVAKTESESEKYWTIRRESFNLLRKHVSGRRTAPFIDDVIVEPKYLPEFLPKMRKILDDYKLLYTIAGHAGNGNFHIIPLMDMKDQRNADVIMEVGDKVYDLVAQYQGSITAEHNDGIIRTPYLGKMYSPQILGVFQSVKNVFDGHNILNPGKKVGGSLSYLRSHIATEAKPQHMKSGS
jgi:FAD/FMN-containing dehydrogenase